MSEINTAKPRRAKRSLAVPAIVAGGLSSLLLAFSLTPTFSALTASIQNQTNTAGVGSIGIMESTNPDGTGTPCSTSASTMTATCTSINKYTGTMTMKAGDSVTQTLYVTNIGSLAATTFTIQGGTCTVGSVTGASVVGTATDLCTKYTISIKANNSTASAGTQVYSATAAAFATASATSLLANGSPAAGGVTRLDITATLASTGIDATYQGRYISQPITITMGA